MKIRDGLTPPTTIEHCRLELLDPARLRASARQRGSRRPAEPAGGLIGATAGAAFHGPAFFLFDCFPPRFRAARVFPPVRASLFTSRLCLSLSLSLSLVLRACLVFRGSNHEAVSFFRFLYTLTLAPPPFFETFFRDFSLLRDFCPSLSRSLTEKSTMLGVVRRGGSRDKEERKLF